jgi:hypothetical protein
MNSKDIKDITSIRLFVELSYYEHNEEMTLLRTGVT